MTSVLIRLFDGILSVTHIILSLFTIRHLAGFLSHEVLEASKPDAIQGFGIWDWMGKANSGTVYYFYHLDEL